MWPILPGISSRPDFGRGDTLHGGPAAVVDRAECLTWSGLRGQQALVAGVVRGNRACFASVAGVIWRLAAAGLSGWALSLAFQPTGWWWAAVPAVAVLIGCCYRQPIGRSAVIGTVFGVAFYLWLLDWVSPVIGADAGLGLALYSGLWIGLTAAAIAILTRLTLWWLWVPCAWVLQEAVSGRIPFGGWGWGRLGFSQDASPLLPWASLWGVPALTFAVVLSAAVLARLVVAVPPLARGTSDPHPGGSRPGMIAPIAALVAVWLLPAAIALPTDSESLAGPASAEVGLVQGNVPQAGLDFNAQRRAVLDNHVRQTMQMAQDVAAGVAAQPDFVLWPENASDIDPYRNADARTQIDAAARSVAAPILVGAVVTDPHDRSQLFNQGIVWDPVTGPGQSYTKRNLVPFGEYVPFRDQLEGRITRFERVPRDFVAGDEPGTLDIGGTRIADAICFDVAFDDALRDATREGGRMLVVQTNNATYNGTSQPGQQFAISRIRAVEHGRAVAVVSTSGLSGVIQADGQVMAGTALGELVPGRYVVRIDQRDTLTVSDRVGAGPEWVVGGIAAAALAVALRLRTVVKSTANVGSGGPPEGIREKQR